MKTRKLTAQYLRTVLKYHPETGLFTWLVSHTNSVPVGSVAGKRPVVAKYIQIGIDRTLHYAHRLAWLYVTGNHPTAEIDHINGDPYDNRFINLRAASRQKNSFNCGKHRNNTSGAKGVHRVAGGWMVRIRHSGKRHNLGTFKSKTLAAQIYSDAAMQYHGEFARL